MLSSGVSLFCTSTLVFVFRLTRTSEEEEYAMVLSKLFRGSKQSNGAVDTSRHTVDPVSKSPTLSTKDAFSLRREFFQNIYNASNLHKAKLIHVAGSKGKGSTVEYIAAALRYQGFKVGVFTSPHLHSARERIKIGKRLISRKALIRLGKEAIKSMEKEPWGVFFDYFLMIALRYFGENHVDYIILEAGIGGRFDSTNFIEAPEVAVITSISLDHQNILGDTLEEIAWQKAGIIKSAKTFGRGRAHIFTSATQSQVVLEVLREQCLQMDAELHEVPVSNDSLDFMDKMLYSSVQSQNASLSMAVIKYLNVSPEGMKTFYWPCRMECFNVGGINVVLDGCHNGDSVRLFMHSLKNNFNESIHVVLFGAGMEKCLNDMIKQLLLSVDCIVMIQSKHFKSMSEADLCKLVCEWPNSGVLATFQDPLTRQDHGTIEKRLEWTINSARYVSIL